MLATDEIPFISEYRSVHSLVRPLPIRFLVGKNSLLRYAVRSYHQRCLNRNKLAAHQNIAKAYFQKYLKINIVRRQAKSRVFLMIKVDTKVIIVLQGRKYHFIFGGKISGRSNRSYDLRKVTWGVKFLIWSNLSRIGTYSSGHNDSENV